SVTATDTVTGSIDGSASITVDAAAPHFTVSIADNTTAGNALDITVTAQDEFGNVDTGYTGTIHFTSSDGQALLPADYTFVAADAGVHTFTSAVVLKTAGSRSVTVTDTVTGTITGSDTVTVS